MPVFFYAIRLGLIGLGALSSVLFAAPPISAATTYYSCNHPYFPLRRGYEINYRHPDQSYLPSPSDVETGKGATDISEDTEAIRVTKVLRSSVQLSSLAKWKETVRSREEGTVTTSKKEHLTQTIYCKKEGLQGLGDINMTPEKIASLTVGKDVDDFIRECGRVKAVSSSGVYLPKILTPTSEWKNTFHIRLPTNDDMAGCGFDIHTTSTYKALGAHPIKVGKKTYTGIAVGVMTEARGKSWEHGEIVKLFDPRVMYWVKGLGFVQISDIYGNVKMVTERVKP